MTATDPNPLTTSPPCPQCRAPINTRDLTGLVDPASWDGILVWRHHCGHMWPRFDAYDHRHALAVAYIESLAPAVALTGATP